MEIKIKTNINCMNCVAKVTPFFNANPTIQSWEVDTKNPEKVLTVRGEITKKQVAELVSAAGFKTLEENVIVETPIVQTGFWQDATTWKRAGKNTLNCLIGCSIGDFGMIIYLQAAHVHVSMAMTMVLAIISGLITSITLETILLKYNEKLDWKQAFSMALGMSLISMIAMEIAMNITDFMITGGKADFHSHTYWLAFGIAAVAGFLAPLPYNYFKLKKYNKACH